MIYRESFLHFGHSLFNVKMRSCMCALVLLHVILMSMCFSDHGMCVASAPAVSNFHNFAHVDKVIFFETNEAAGQPHQAEYRYLCYTAADKGHIAVAAAEAGYIQTARRRYDARTQRVVFTVDSGAARTAVPPEIGAEFAIQPTSRSLSGFRYYTASGEAVADQGTRTIQGIFAGGTDSSSVGASVVKIKRALLSVAEFCDLGKKVLLPAQEDGSRTLKVVVG